MAAFQNNRSRYPFCAESHTIRHDKPELHLHVGQPVDLSVDLSIEEQTTLFEEHLWSLMQQLHSAAGFNDEFFERLI